MACADDCEDVCEDEGAKHAGREPDVDGEPGLGWTVDGVPGNSDGMDHEAGGSSVTEAHRQRYETFDRYTTIRNSDGRHVDSRRSGANRRLINLSDRQHAALAPRVDRDEVRIWLEPCERPAGSRRRASLVAEHLPTAITATISITSVHVTIAAGTVIAAIAIATISIPISVAVRSINGRRANTTMRAADHRNILYV